MGGNNASATIFMALTIVFTCAALSDDAGGSPFDQCDAAVSDEPEELESYICYWRTARNLRAWPEAVRRLDALLAIQPDNHRAKLYLGVIEADMGNDRAEGLYRSALEKFLEEGDLTGEVYTRISLEIVLRNSGRIEQAARQLEGAIEAAARSGDPLLIARADIHKGWCSFYANDFGHAWIRFRQAEKTVFPEGPGDLQIRVLDGLGATSWISGRYRQALDYYRQEAALVRQGGNVSWEAGVRANIAHMAREIRDPRPLSLEELVSTANEALETAVKAGNRRAEASARLLLGQCLPGEAGRAELERALQISREIDYAKIIIETLAQLAVNSARTDPSDPVPAYAYANEALRLADTVRNPTLIAAVKTAIATLGTMTGSNARTVPDYLAALDAIEKIRELQRDDTIRAAAFSRWATVYYRFADYLRLGAGDGSTSREDLALAFRVIERLRSRVLLDNLDTAGAVVVGDPSIPQPAERERVLDAIAAVQLRLIEQSLTEEQRRDALSELERLELQEEALRDEISRLDSSFAELRDPEFPSLEEVRETLEDDQVILSFHYRGEDRESWNETVPRPWILAVSRDMVKAYSLPEREEIETTVLMYLGLIQRRDGSETGAAVNLYRLLFDDVFRELDPAVRRMVIVPDGLLHRVPFGTLRADERSPPLATAYEISFTPSVTVWMRWRGSAGEVGGESNVLALADPDLPASGDDSTPIRDAGAFAEYLGLKRLPDARREARAMVDRAGNRSLLVEGSAANESFLKSSVPGRYSVLHLAVHAVLDEVHPERSALVLAPGEPDQDGLLQIREIVDLDLQGYTVILSACSSASGNITAGEGVMGLARAFFQAGAHAVVGSLWPLRDEEATRLVSDLSRRLAAGDTLGGALAFVQRKLIDEEAPTASWAGMIVLGDADRIPLGAAPSNIAPPWSLAPAALFLIAAGVLCAYLLARKRSGGRN